MIMNEHDYMFITLFFILQSLARAHTAVFVRVYIFYLICTIHIIVQFATVSFSHSAPYLNVCLPFCCNCLFVVRCFSVCGLFFCSNDFEILNIHVQLMLRVLTDLFNDETRIGNKCVPPSNTMTMKTEIN